MLPKAGEGDQKVDVCLHHDTPGRGVLGRVSRDVLRRVQIGPLPRRKRRAVLRDRQAQSSHAHPKTNATPYHDTPHDAAPHASAAHAHPGILVHTGIPARCVLGRNKGNVLSYLQNRPLPGREERAMLLHGAAQSSTYPKTHASAANAEANTKPYSSAANAGAGVIPAQLRRHPHGRRVLGHRRQDMLGPL